MSLKRRSLLGRAGKWAAVLGLSGPALLSQTQRAVQPTLNVLQYVVSEGQRLFTLVSLGGGQAGPIIKVMYSTIRDPDFYRDLDPAVYRVVGNGWGLEVLSGWEDMARVMVLHQ